MDYSDKTKQELQEGWAGCEPEDIALAFLEDLEALIGNDPDYFADGRGNSLSHTLQMAANTVRAASQPAYVNNEGKTVYYNE